ncbi:hypothetical protein BABINDRAFT_169581 [Babjeviella inositovora NRRL Y-12698]|uniref:Uncharacterized protein n=1 Tax=Babjeviella inositovora NRRL Y-12698 TaxID=984486 RepID=A0A1E3QGT7_9ASCO|nr:uncharacterized protein BABINDRAFT_169581 [Babjeviella inositovora NRRL Y-12698]ODQ76915.1 hypothetical protein BABINDRAFT_169581 [Babjeviella inositovora NRRL Y-12698]
MKNYLLTTSPYGKDNFTEIQTQQLLTNLANTITPTNIANINDTRYYSNNTKYSINAFFPSDSIIQEPISSYYNLDLGLYINEGKSITLNDLSIQQNAYDVSNNMVKTLAKLNSIPNITLTVNSNNIKNDTAILQLTDTLYQNQRVSATTNILSYNLALNNRTNIDNIKHTTVLQQIKDSDTGCLNVKIVLK